MPTLTARGVRKTFHSLRRQRQTVLAGVDLEISTGEVVGLIGPNGAGKTTLMSCLLGFLHPDAGEVLFDGLTNDDLSIRARTGFVPERMNIGRRETGWQFLRYMALLAGVPKREVAARCDGMLERLGLAQARNRRLSEYSRGMLQRIALCQALIHQPDYVFLDEPTSGLDPGGVLLVRDLITEQKRRGAMVLLNSHQLGEVEKVCDRVVFLHNGVIARAETLRHIDRLVVSIRLLAGSYEPGVVQRITGSAPQDDVLIVAASSEAEIAGIVRQLVTEGAGVVEVRAHTADLEGIFRGIA
jgi:ABC-2 type transport system ATP-binding protein